MRLSDEVLISIFISSFLTTVCSEDIETTTDHSDYCQSLCPGSPGSDKGITEKDYFKASNKVAFLNSPSYGTDGKTKCKTVDCFWTIEAPINHMVEFQVNMYSLSDLSDGLFSVDDFEILDGNSNLSPTILSYKDGTHSNITHKFRSSGKYLSILFMDANHKTTGFMGSYKAIPFTNIENPKQSGSSWSVLGPISLIILILLTAGIIYVTVIRERFPQFKFSNIGFRHSRLPSQPRTEFLTTAELDMEDPHPYAANRDQSYFQNL